MTSYFDEAEIQKRVTRRLRRRFIFVSHMLMSILVFISAIFVVRQWFLDNVNYDLEGYPFGIGSSVYYTRLALPLLIISIILVLHLMYFLYQEILERTVLREIETFSMPGKYKRKHNLKMSTDGELVADSDQNHDGALDDELTMNPHLKR